MNVNDSDFGSLFDDNGSQQEDFLSDSDISLDDAPDLDFGLDDSEIKLTDTVEDVLGQTAPAARKKRTSEDFSPDMDMILITAQSSMIIEGTRMMSIKKYGASTLETYREAINGIELYIKLIERNPASFHKLLKQCSADIDCQEVSNIVINLYKTRFGEEPDSDERKLKAFEILRDRLKNAYYKALISRTMSSMKKYFLLSGDLDTAKVSRLIETQNRELASDVLTVSEHIKIALALLKSGNAEIIQGMKGKDMNVFIIKASSLLSHYSRLTGQSEAADYYMRMYSTYSRYFIIR